MTYTKKHIKNLKNYYYYIKDLSILIIIEKKSITKITIITKNNTKILIIAFQIF